METTIINITVPPPQMVNISANETAENIVVNVSAIGEKGDQGIPGTGGGEGSLNYFIDAGTSVITTGLKGFVEWGFAATVTGWTILSDILGSIVVDVWKDNYGNFQPTVADTIAGTEKPTLTNSKKNQDLSLTSFSTIVLKGDIWAFNVDSITDIKKVTIAFRFNKN